MKGPVMTDLAATTPSLPGRRSSLDSIGLGAMVAAVIAISWSPIMIRFTDIGPAGSAFWRLMFALPVLLLWTRGERLPFGSMARRGPLTGEGLLAAITAGVAFAADLAFFHAAMPLTSVANASFIANLAPVVAVLAAFLLLGERASLKVVFALGIALVGVAITSGVLQHGMSIRQGDILAVGAALSYAIYLVAIRLARATRSAANVTLVSTTVAAMVLLAMAVLDGGPLLPHSAQGWLVVIGLGLVCQVLGQGLSAVGIGRLSSSIVALLLLAHPVASAVLAWFVFGEAVGFDQMIGGALILGAVVLARR